MSNPTRERGFGSLPATDAAPASAPISVHNWDHQGHKAVQQDRHRRHSCGCT